MTVLEEEQAVFFIASSDTVCKSNEESTYKSSGLQIIRRVVGSGRESDERKNKRKAKEFNNPGCVKVVKSG